MDISKARELDQLGREIDVLVVVKTAPIPSEKYKETVCVAGVALDPLRWVRLYPIAFRFLDGTDRFKKYQTIRVSVRAPNDDDREESLRVEKDPQPQDGPITGWDERAIYLDPLPTKSLCELRAEAMRNPAAQSLALITPRATPTIKVSLHPGWNEQQKAALRKYKDEDIFGNKGLTLEAPRFVARLEFYCNFPSCSRHSLTITDWEAVALQRHWPPTASIEYAQQEFEKKFIREREKPGVPLRIIVGNQAAPHKRHSFLVLGIFGSSRETLGLF